MVDDENKPDPVEDLKKGLGLLFRAAQAAVRKLPTEKVEEVVKTGVKEVGRALGNVAEVLDGELTKRRAAPPAEAAPPVEREKHDAPADESVASENPTEGDKPPG